MSSKVLLSIDAAFERAGVDPVDREEVLGLLAQQSDEDLEILLELLNTEDEAALFFIDNFKKKKESLDAGGEGWNEILEEEQAYLDKLNESR